MLDRLLGRASLKERLETLEEEKRHLERRLDAEQERRADAVSDRQTAQERANHLEDRVTELEDRVERLQAGEAAYEFRRETELADERLDEVLARLESVETEPEGALTAYVEDGRDLPSAVSDVVGDRAGLVGRAAPCLVTVDDAGLVAATLSTPVAPDPFTEWADGFTIDRSWFQPTGEYAVALVRSDLFALGEYDGRERVAFHGFDSDLKSQHSKGGFSQARFERLRDAQIDSHIERCLAALEEREGDDASATADRLYVVGERSLLSRFSDLADATQPVDATGDPEDALADAVHEFFTVQLRLL
jgi:peptide subunit release factor 1 (eRF1)